MPAASAPAGGAAASAATEAPAEVSSNHREVDPRADLFIAHKQEKPKEKTIFTVKLEKIDPAAKAKIIKEVKAIMPNMNLVEVRHACLCNSRCRGDHHAHNILLLPFIFIPALLPLSPRSPEQRT
jgi:hypothetical protein